MHRVCTSYRLRPDLGQTDMADVTRLHELGDRADRLLDGHRGVETRGTIDVHVVEPETREAVREGVLHGDGARVVPDEAPGRVTQGTELHGDLRAIPLATKGPADEQLVPARPVEVARVDHRHTTLERSVDRRDPFRFVRVTVHADHAHRAERDRERA